MLELSDKDSKAAIIKMIQQSVVKSLETNEKIKKLIKNSVYVYVHIYTHTRIYTYIYMAVFYWYLLTVK